MFSQVCGGGRSPLITVVCNIRRAGLGLRWRRPTCAAGSFLRWWVDTFSRPRRSIETDFPLAGWKLNKGKEKVYEKFTSSRDAAAWRCKPAQPSVCSVPRRHGGRSISSSRRQEGILKQIIVPAFPRVQGGDLPEQEEQGSKAKKEVRDTLGRRRRMNRNVGQEGEKAGGDQS